MFANMYDGRRVLVQTGGQKNGAAQHEQPDDNHPGRFRDFDVEVPRHRWYGHGDRHAGQLHQHLRRRQSNQGFPALRAGPQFAERADYVKPL